ncbi:hypothetical protein FACS1894152_7260 [Bacilli bacterium]|nr:hypothetical protein FACS1894152_7260 [Bacilli bacterium]
MNGANVNGRAVMDRYGKSLNFLPEVMKYSASCRIVNTSGIEPKMLEFDYRHSEEERKQKLAEFLFENRFKCYPSELNDMVKEIKMRKQTKN